MVSTPKKTSTHILVATLACSLAACGLLEGTKAAEQSADVLYQTLASGNIEAPLDLYSPRFYQETDREEWLKILTSVHDRLGDYKSRELVNWNLRTNVGTEMSGTVTTLVYKVQYSKHDATEQLVFWGANPPQLIGHHFNSKGFLLE